ncbi:MAG TPA: PLD nuclease N-terminal domain-containing protein [Nocardioidaceae bacterium]|nr:PLD nuclease N-terminal domain-containing protein [Nocardioidaceae bacterium]
MARFYALLSIASLVLCIFCVIRAITTPDGEVKYLPKVGWILLILFFPLVGSIAWLAVGRERPQRATGPASAYPEYDRPGRAAGATPESDQEFLKRVRERAEEQRRRAAEQKKRDQDGSAEPGEPGEATPPPAGS